MWVGDLIEHEENAVQVDVVEGERGQRARLERHALMHGVGPKKAIEVLRRDRLGAQSPFGDEIFESLRGIFRGLQAQDGPVRIGERGFDGMDAKEDDAFGLSAPPRTALFAPLRRGEGFGMT